MILDNRQEFWGKEENHRSGGSNSEPQQSNRLTNFLDEYDKVVANFHAVIYQSLVSPQISLSPSRKPPAEDSKPNARKQLS